MYDKIHDNIGGGGDNYLEETEMRSRGDSLNNDNDNLVGEKN